MIILTFNDELSHLNFQIGVVESRIALLSKRDTEQSRALLLKENEQLAILQQKKAALEKQSGKA